MTKILEFLSKYHLIFDIISLFLILSLIGFYATRKKEKNFKFKIAKENTKQNIDNVKENHINTNMSLQELVKENKNVNHLDSNWL